MRRRAQVITALSLLIQAAFAAPATLGATADVELEARAGTVRVATGNIREGSLVRYRADLRDPTDRRSWVRRLLRRPGRLPDVVLLQEALGSAQWMAAALNADPNAVRGGASYGVVTHTAQWFESGRCAGPRDGRFSVLRSSTILVNRQTVPAVEQRGEIRTWGRWNPVARTVTGRHGHGCTAHPWARFTIERPGAEPRTVTVLSVHVAPSGPELKNRAIQTLTRQVGRLRQAPDDMLVIGGDFNLNRCRQPVRAPEPRGCTVRAGHRGLIEAGYVDSVRRLHPAGPYGVVGVSHRIDFIYTSGVPTAAWYDRCYEAYHVSRWACGTRRGAFSDGLDFWQCQQRSLHESPEGICTQAELRRYYSDHPIVESTIR